MKTPIPLEVIEQRIKDNVKLAQVVPVLPWGHHIERMELKDLLVYDMKN